MDNQHRQIRGYRDFDAEEIERINALKAQFAIMRATIEEIRGDPRCRALAITKLEESEMWAVRGIAMPQT